MVVGITMVRDERDILPSTITHMLKQVDTLIVADNGSVDGSYEYLLGLWQNGASLRLERDEDPAYFQSRKMTALAEQARQAGATWVVPFDADELWFTRDGRRIADVLTDLPDDILIAEADLWDHVSTALDSDVEDPVARIGWRRAHPAPLPKVAVRALPGLTVAQGNHCATFGDVAHPPTVKNLLTIRHFAYRSAEQTIRKIRNGAQAYAATDLPVEQGGHWRGWGRILDEHGEAAISGLYRKWHYREDPAAPLTIDDEEQLPLIFDPAPVG